MPLIPKYIQLEQNYEETFDDNLSIGQAVMWLSNLRDPCTIGFVFFVSCQVLH